MPKVGILPSNLIGNDQLWNCAAALTTLKKKDWWFLGELCTIMSLQEGGKAVC